MQLYKHETQFWCLLCKFLPNMDFTLSKQGRIRVTFRNIIEVLFLKSVARTNNKIILFSFFKSTTTIQQTNLVYVYHDINASHWHKLLDE